MVELEKIRALTDSRTYARGNLIYKSGGIQEFRTEREADGLHIFALAEGNVESVYEVHLLYSPEQDQFTGAHCECLAFQTYSGLCKHCVAAALAFCDEEMREKKGEQAGKYIPPTDRLLTQVMYSGSMREKSRYFQPEITGRVELWPVLLHRGKEWYGEFRIGIDHKYVVKNIGALMENVWNYAYAEYGKKLAFYHERSAFTPESRAVLDFLEAYVLEFRSAMRSYDKQRGYGYSYMGNEEGMIRREILLTDIWMVRLAKILAGKSCALEGSRLKEEMTFLEENPKLSVQLKETESGGYRLEMPAAEVFGGQENCCIRVGSTMYICSPEFTRDMGEAIRLFQTTKSAYSIHPADAAVFCSAVLPALEKCTSCRTAPSLENRRPKALEIRIFLDYEQGTVTGKVLFVYGDTEYNMLDTVTVREMHRDFEKEHAAEELIRRYFTWEDPARGLVLLEDHEEEKLFDLLETGISGMQEMGTVYISESLKRIRGIRTPVVRIGVSMKSGLLDLDIGGEGFSEGELEGILSGYRRKRKFYRLEDGTFLRLQENGLSAVAELAEGLELKGRDLARGEVSVPAFRAFYLDRILQENSSQLEVQRDQAFRSLLRGMKNVEDSEFEVPEGLSVSLRPYQVFGFRWMMTLSALGFGGILADDMGLGKTVQAIAYLLGQRRRIPDYTALVVCPASLVYNWEAEIRRFAPGISVSVIAGSRQVRRERINGCRGMVAITSYDLLKRDIEAYEGLTVDDLIIDEAQNVKNFNTQAARAVRAVKSRRRFALTGTPIENSLSELWSIFDFLMPGILSSNKRFRDRYEQPIVNGQDERVSLRLKRMIRPFILRRTKSEVLRELPDKLEKVIYSVMEGPQRELYQASVQRLKASLEKQSEDEFKTGKLQILAELTRLRQICCDPSMAYENFRGESAKTETCMELLRTAAAAGSRVLLFSQFTTALDIIRVRLEKEKIGFFMLTGSTPKEKRAEMVEEFNKGDTPVFLISLKAGGTGLNLTAASVVIHFDPWWNMAAQNQATDRAHRIGQKQVVTVYKLIMKDTLEEKILQLQERKARLSDEVISGGSLQNTLATREEILEILQMPS